MSRADSARMGAVRARGAAWAGLAFGGPGAVIFPWGGDV